jgi:Family of unknown function (DUF6644)
MLLLAGLQATAEALPLNPIARWEWVFPLIESLHILGFTLLVGSVVILDFRLLGISLRGQPISRVARDLAPYIWAGLFVQLTTGPYLFSGDPGDYVQVPAFRNKMVLLLLALVFHLAVMGKATAAKWDDEVPLWRKPVAVISLASWLSVLLAGVWIGSL